MPLHVSMAIINGQLRSSLTESNESSKPIRDWLAESPDSESKGETRSSIQRKHLQKLRGRSSLRYPRGFLHRISPEYGLSFVRQTANLPHVLFRRTFRHSGGSRSSPTWRNQRLGLRLRSVCSILVETATRFTRFTTCAFLQIMTHGP
jgi:hypothetical protein